MTLNTERVMVTHAVLPPRLIGRLWVRRRLRRIMAATLLEAQCKLPYTYFKPHLVPAHVDDDTGQWVEDYYSLAATGEQS